MQGMCCRACALSGVEAPTTLPVSDPPGALLALGPCRHMAHLGGALAGVLLVLALRALPTDDGS